MSGPDAIERAMADISHTTDGPVTPFVLMVRAMRAVAAGGDPTVYANALWDALHERGIEVGS